MYELQIPNGYFHLWNMYLNQHETAIDQLEFLKPYRDQIHQILLKPVDAQSPYDFFKKMMELTYVHLDCPALIFEMAQFIRVEHFGVLGYMATRAESVAEALQHILKFSRLVIDGKDLGQLTLSQKDQEIYFRWPHLSEDYVLLNEMTMACMVRLAREIFPENQLGLLRVEFAHHAQCAFYHYSKFFQCEPVFEQKNYALVLRLDSMQSKSLLADAVLMKLLLKQAEDAIAAKPKTENVIQQIQYFLADYLVTYEASPKIEQVAEELLISPRTLQRVLKEQNTTFKQLLEVERMKRCEQLLQQNTPLFELALKLGYSDQSALARAYKAYTGMTLVERRKSFKSSD